MFLKTVFIYLEPTAEAPIQVVALQIILISLSVFVYKIMEIKGEIFHGLSKLKNRYNVVIQ